MSGVLPAICGMLYTAVLSDAVDDPDTQDVARSFNTPEPKQLEAREGKGEQSGFNSGEKKF